MFDTKQKTELTESFKRIMFPKKHLKLAFSFIIAWETVDFFLNFLRETTHSNFIEIINFFTPLVAISVSITIFIKSSSKEKIIKQKIINLLYPFVFGSFFFCLLHLFTKYVFPESALNHLIFQPNSIKIFSRTVENTIGGNFIHPPGNYLSFFQGAYILYLPLTVFLQLLVRINIIKSKGNIPAYTANAIKTIAALYLLAIPIWAFLFIVFAKPNSNPNYLSYANLTFSSFMGGLTPICITMFLPSIVSLNIEDI